MQPTSVEYGHQASEVVRFGNAWYWGAYDGEEIRFRKVTWANAPHCGLTNVDLAGVVDAKGAVGAQLRVVECALGGGRVRLRVDMPWRDRMTLRVYDVAGRRVRTLVDGLMDKGSTVMAWDGKNESGSRVASGVYFVRLGACGGVRVVRVVLAR